MDTDTQKAAQVKDALPLYRRRNSRYSARRDSKQPFGDSRRCLAGNGEPSDTVTIKKVKRPPTEEVVIVSRLSILDAAHRVLEETKKSLTTREIITVAAEKQYWISTTATPWAILHAVLSRDMKSNGTKSRFEKKERKKFTLR